MTRALRTRSASISVDELLAHSAWYGQIGAAAQRQFRTDIVERAIASGSSLGHHGETQRYWYGVLEGLLKWAINAPDGRTVTLGGQSVGSWFGEGTLLRGQPRKADLVALRHSRVAMIPLDTFAPRDRLAPALRREPGCHEARWSSAVGLRGGHGSRPRWLAAISGMTASISPARAAIAATDKHFPHLLVASA